MDDASDRNLGRLLELTEQMIDERQSDLSEAARPLVDVGASADDGTGRTKGRHGLT